MVKKLQLYQLDKSRMTADRIGELKALLTTDPKKYRAFVLLKPIMGKIEREVAEIMEDDEMYNFDAFDEFCSTKPAYKEDEVYVTKECSDKLNLPIIENNTIPTILDDNIYNIEQLVGNSTPYVK